jgi:chloramphenicol-sensitive protein RarD
MPTPQADSGARAGVLGGLACYVLWGFLPLLFDLLKDTGSVAIVANRTIWSLLFVGAILLASRRMGEVRAALRDPGTLRSLVISSLLLASNWLIYVWAVDSGQALEGSFGYFINPLVNVAIGMALLGERLSPWQRVAIGVAILAIALQAIGIGRIPFIALSLALSFGFYGFFRKTVRVNSTAGLFIETLILVPLAIGYLVWLIVQQRGLGPMGVPLNATLLVITGPATAVPLLLFAFAVRRLRLTTIGMLQYLSPTIQFLLAVFVLREPINLTQLASFALIAVSLAIYSGDSIIRRRSAAAAGATG